MADLTYVQEYFSRYAERWNQGHYNTDRWPSTYPIGQRRVEVTLEKVVESLGRANGRLIDLGCGGGVLCVHAARLGFDVVGIDIAEGMLDEARKLAESVTARADQTGEHCGHIDLRCCDVLQNDLETGSADAVTALGLIEYLPSDVPFFAEASRLLRQGGVLVLSARNRLFNLTSLNDYTAAEMKDGGAAALLDEICGLATAGIDEPLLRDFARRLSAVSADLEAALTVDLAHQSAGSSPPGFVQVRRQHSPADLNAAAARHGFQTISFTGVHPHPLPSAWEHAAPRFYNLLASAFDGLASSPVALRWSSTTMAVFTKC